MIRERDLKCGMVADMIGLRWSTCTIGNDRRKSDEEDDYNMDNDKGSNAGTTNLLFGWSIVAGLEFSYSRQRRGLPVSTGKSIKLQAKDGRALTCFP